MTFRRPHLACLLLAATLVATTTSCRSKKDNIIRYTTHRTSTKTATETDSTQQWRALQVNLTERDNRALYEELRSWLGTPYQYGGNTRRGTDCSGMVMVVFQNVYGISVERNSALIFEKNCRKISKSDLCEGDLVFFNNGKSQRITHVGIYLKEGKFVHASSSRGVIVSDLNEKYYISHWQCAGRVKKK